MSHCEFYPNGYGVSVICNEHSYGLELAVLKGNKDYAVLCYDTPITDDVLGGLTIKDLHAICQRVKALPNCIPRKLKRVKLIKKIKETI